MDDNPKQFFFLPSLICFPVPTRYRLIWLISRKNPSQCVMFNMDFHFSTKGAKAFDGLRLINFHPNGSRGQSGQEENLKAAAIITVDGIGCHEQE
jgi:hypothetical protein